MDPFAQRRDGVSSEKPTRVQIHSAREELAQYKALKVPAKYSHPLLFWKENAEAYPLLSSVARRILSISASLAQSEKKRDFSSVGRTITDARTRLSAAKVEAIELVRWGVRASLISSSS